VVTVPGSIEELVAEAHNQDVLDHLLAKVMIDTEDLLLLPVRLESLLEVAGALKVLSERLLDLFSEAPVSSLFSIKGVSQLTIIRAMPFLG
jgi:hypothetical protein